MPTGQTHAVMVNGKVYGDNLWVDQTSLWFRKRVYFSSFATAATTVNLDVVSFPAGVVIEGGGIALVTNFTGGGASTATLSVGTTGSAAAYVAATDVFAGAFKTIPGAAIVPFTLAAGLGAPAASTVRIQLISDVNCSLLTAGKADVYLKLSAVSIRTT